MARCPTCHRRLRAGAACPVHDGPVAPAGPPHAPGAAPAWSRPLGACVGAGGFAAVWELVDGGVLKVSHADHALALARMAREAEALAAVGAPAVPRLDGHGVLPDGRAWLAMERIAGASLAALTAEGPMRVDRAVEIAIATLDALVRVHAAGFVHRDLKPDNLVRRADGRVVILDLGLARKVPDDPDDPTRAGIQVGSLEYMPPEQLLDSAAIDARADLYAVGCVLYELCAGRPPFVGDAHALERAHAALRPPPLGALATVPAALETLVHDCLGKLPARRPPSALELRSRLLTMREATPSLQRAPHSMTVIREGTQPVVLLWAELPRVDRALLAVLAARKVGVLSQRGRRVVGAAIGAEHADPVAAAIAAARELAAGGARVALHLDALRVTAGGGVFAVTGAAAERPEDWLPPSPWTGIVLTRALATVTPAPTRPGELGPDFVLLGEPGASTELFGRDALLADVTADAAAALAGSGPGLAVMVGELAVGKSAFAAALGPRLRELGARVHAAVVPPPGSGRTAASALADLIGAPAGPLVRAIGDALRAAARARPTAVVLDDLHLAAHEFLDALEYATLGGEPLPLWILGIASPRLEARRPGFGRRAERHRRDTLLPLDEDAAVAMAAALLRPAAYPPLRALRRLAAIARGNPLHLRSLVREIHERGAVRRRSDGEFFLDTTALDALPPLALGPWLAARELAPLGVELVALARVCAVLGEELERDEVAEVVARVEARGGATTTVDVDVGLRELTAAGILVGGGRDGGGRWAFRQALVREGVYATTDPDERRALHQAALEHGLSRSAGTPASAERIARHAEAVGASQIAATAFARLGERALVEHRLFDADQAWQGAVRNLLARDRARARALLGRARALSRMQRLGDALDVLEEARSIAAELGELDLEVEAILERATTLDTKEDYEGAGREAARARARYDASPRRADLGLRVELAEARALFRAQQLRAAVERLGDVLARARAAGDRDTQTVAALLLGPALVDLGEVDAARPVFADVITLCEAHQDRFHLAAALANRSWLSFAVGDVEGSAHDLRAVIQLTREGGHAHHERAATHNLAEDRLLQGSLDEALALARRSLAILRAHEGAPWLDQLLVARILAARQDRPALAALLDELDAAEVPAAVRPVLHVLRCAATCAPALAWEAALAQALPDASVDTRLELGLLALADQRLPEARHAELAELARAHPIWSRRWAALAR